LRADLDDAAVLARRSDHLLSFPDVIGKWLFHINILGGLTRRLNAFMLG
jgi:hypothetical protein